MSADRQPGSGLAQRLRAGGTLHGLIVKMPSPALVEICGHAGFDFVLIDTEHGPGDVEALEHHVRAADSAGIGTLVRVGSAQPIEILRALDAGACGIVVPHVSGPEAVQAAVDAAYYPPVGHRSVALSTRAGRHGLSTAAEHVQAALDNTLVVAQIEDGDALERAAAIAASPRLDAVFVGPTDLSMSLGVVGDASHPAVLDAIDRISEAVLAADQTALCVLAGDAGDARGWAARGARMILFSASAVISERLSSMRRELMGRE